MRNMSDREKKKDRVLNDKNLKSKIEKAMILMAFLIIMTALFLIPKYQAYALNREILREKTSLGNELSDEMTEEEYLEALGMIREKLETNRMIIPDNIDAAGLYTGIMQMAESAKVVLISVKFSPIETRIDDDLGTKIQKELTENEEKLIKGPDGRVLATCEFVIICSGDDVNCISFLEKLGNYQPMIKVIDFEMKGEVLKDKTMTLRLASYGRIDREISETSSQNSMK